MRAKKAERVRQNIMKVPDTEYLKKQEEDKKLDVWQRYLFKEKDLQKKQKLTEKKANEMKEHLKEKKEEKAVKIQTNIKNVESDLKDK